MAQWHKADVASAGPAEDGTIYIRLRADELGGQRWFCAIDPLKKEMLAVALAAMSTGLQVGAFLEDDPVEYSKIYGSPAESVGA